MRDRKSCRIPLRNQNPGSRYGISSCIQVCLCVCDSALTCVGLAATCTALLLTLALVIIMSILSARRRRHRRHDNQVTLHCAGQLTTTTYTRLSHLDPMKSVSSPWFWSRRRAGFKQVVNVSTVPIDTVRLLVKVKHRRRGTYLLYCRYISH